MNPAESPRALHGYHLLPEPPRLAESPAHSPRAEATPVGTFDIEEGGLHAGDTAASSRSQPRTTLQSLYDHLPSGRAFIRHLPSRVGTRWAAVTPGHLLKTGGLGLLALLGGAARYQYLVNERVEQNLALLSKHVGLPSGDRSVDQRCYDLLRDDTKQRQEISEDMFIYDRSEECTPKQHLAARNLAVDYVDAMADVDAAEFLKCSDQGVEVGTENIDMLARPDAFHFNFDEPTNVYIFKQQHNGTITPEQRAAIHQAFINQQQSRVNRSAHLLLDVKNAIVTDPKLRQAPGSNRALNHLEAAYAQLPGTPADFNITVPTKHCK